MSRRRFFLSFRSFALSGPTLCRLCQQRTFSSSPRYRAIAPQAALQKQFPHRLPDGRDQEYEPKPLGRPIGFQDPPRTGNDLDKDSELTAIEKNLKQRKELQKQLIKPYFMDISNTKYQRGKAWLGNPKMFKGEASLYFPNFRGSTLQSSSVADTTPVLDGKISVVNVFSSLWGQNQVETFVGEEANPAINDMINANPDVAQRVDISIEENWLKQAMIKMYNPSLRKNIPKSRHGKYFNVSKDVTTEIRETIGLIANAKVGYVYLLDDKCRIRWAACADASNMEKDTLARCFKRLIEERKTTS